MESTELGQKNVPKPVQKRSKFRSFLKFIRNVAVILLFFVLGIQIGNGSFLVLLNQPISSNTSLPTDLDYREVEQIYDLLRANYDGDLDVDTLIDGLKSGLITASGDPYTEYLNAKDAKEFNDQLSGTFSGIGAELGVDDQENILIVAPLSGFPAEKAGLRPKDIILSVDGTTTAGLSITEVVSRIRGPVGTEVTLEILRGESERKEVSIVREDITVPSVNYEILEGNIGYIQIIQFWTDTEPLTKEASAAFKKSGVEKIILDLRGNPGGSLPASVDVASLWLQSGKTILEERRDGNVDQVYKATGNPIFRGMETVVLIDEGSASASEIVAGALKDNGAAVLVGQTSYGKGSVQQIIPLRGGGELKVTIGRWHRPNGDNIDKKGIEPDYEVEVTEEDIAADQDPQRDKAIELLQSQ